MPFVYQRTIGLGMLTPSTVWTPFIVTERSRVRQTY